MQPLTTSTFYEPHQHHHHYILGHFHEQYRTSERYFLDQVGDSTETEKRNKNTSGKWTWWCFRQIRYATGTHLTWFLSKTHIKF